jgi:esterase FrsA
LDSHADEVIMGLISQARRPGDGRVAHFGLSFGGNFSAMSGLVGAVDAAIVLGGPVDAAFSRDNFAQLMFAMADIAGNAYGFDAPPTLAQMLEVAKASDRRQLLDRSTNAAMLVINGAADVHVPRADTLIFDGRPHTEVHLLPGAGHCATSKLGEVLTITLGWLHVQLEGAQNHDYRSVR